MRLLNVYNLKFGTFADDDIPPYAIASHRWCEDEASYRNVLDDKTGSEGFKKIRGFCRFVKWRNKLIREKQVASSQVVQRIEWIWIDTCCIDQTSSAEVAENINSMYRYYEEAAECYAYLHDVHGTALTFGNLEELRKGDWFKRGWTLQELVAPQRVIFLSSSWHMLGHKCPESIWLRCGCVWGDAALNAILSRITQIPLARLRKQRQLPRLSLDEAVVWLRNRQTTKIEDLAYCLLGMLGVYMSPIYGEGAHAWIRLEEELTKKNSLGSGQRRPPQIERLISRQSRQPSLVQAKRPVPRQTKWTAPKVRESVASLSFPLVEEESLSQTEVFETAWIQSLESRHRLQSPAFTEIWRQCDEFSMISNAFLDTGLDTGDKGVDEGDEDDEERQRRREGKRTNGRGGGGSGGGGGNFGHKRPDDSGPRSRRGPPPGPASSNRGGSSTSSGRFDVPRSKLAVCCY